MSASARTKAAKRRNKRVRNAALRGNANTVAPWYFSVHVWLKASSGIAARMARDFTTSSSNCRKVASGDS